MRKKELTTGVALFATIILGGISVQAAEIDTESEVRAKLVSGGMTLEAFDLDLGSLTLGEDLTRKGKNKDIVKVTDYTGGNGWTLNVKQDNYNEVNDTLGLTLTGDDGEVNLTDSDAFFATDKSQVAPIIRNSTVSANWGNTPKIGEYKADLTWTLSPGITVPDVDIPGEKQDDGTLVSLIRPGYTRGEDNDEIMSDIYGKFEENSDGSLTLIGISGDGKTWVMSSDDEKPEYKDELSFIEGRLNLPDTINGNKITKIAPNVFYGTSFDEELSLGKYLIEIGDYAFKSNFFTGDLILNEDLERIGKNAFNGPNFMGGHFVMNDKLIEIDDYAFEQNDMYGEFKMGKSLERIGDGAFTNNYFTGSFDPNDALVYLGDMSFFNSEFTGTFNMTNLKSIEAQALMSSKFTKVEDNQVATLGLESIGLATEPHSWLFYSRSK